jgi:hypothetical protein
MTNLVTGIVGIVMVTVFMGFMVVWVPAPPLIIICLAVLALLVHDFIRTIRGGYFG